MLRKTIVLAAASLVMCLAGASKVDAWGAYHVGYTHYSPYTGVHHYGYTDVNRGYGGYDRYHSSYRGYGDAYHYGYHYGGYGGAGGYHYGYVRRY